MINEEAVGALRRASRHSTPAETARLLRSFLPEGLRQDTLVFYLKRAIPGIPLKILIDAQAWDAVGPGPVTDAEVDEMLRPWWPDSGTEGRRADGEVSRPPALGLRAGYPIGSRKNA